MVVLYYLPQSWLSREEQDIVATWIFIAAAITDWADGYLARKLNQTSAFGAFLDPVADKLIVAAALIVLVQLGRVDALVACIIIGREITISALREWMAKLGSGKSVAVSMLGKIKTTAQMVAIPTLLYPAIELAEGLDTRGVGIVLIWIASFLTLWSMAYYLQMAQQEIVRQAQNRVGGGVTLPGAQ